MSLPVYLLCPRRSRQATHEIHLDILGSAHSAAALKLPAMNNTNSTTRTFNYTDHEIDDRA